MTKPGETADIEPIISRKVVGRQVHDALHKMVGRGTDWSVKQLESRSGVSARMIESAMADPDKSVEWRALRSEAIFSIAAVLGAEFTSVLISVADQGAFDLPEDDGTPPAEIAADNAEDNATLTRAALDNKIDGDEKPQLRVVSSRMITRGMKLRSMVA